MSLFCRAALNTGELILPKPVLQCTGAGSLHTCMKSKPAHFAGAFCDGCTLAGLNVKVLGVSDSMKSHLQKCDYVSEAVHSWAKDWTKDSEPFVSDAADSGIVTPSGPSQSGLQRFMPLKDIAMSATQQEEFHMLLLKGTVSGNLPFSWIDNEYIQAAFAIVFHIVCHSHVLVYSMSLLASLTYT